MSISLSTNYQGYVALAPEVQQQNSAARFLAVTGIAMAVLAIISKLPTAEAMSRPSGYDPGIYNACRDTCLANHPKESASYILNCIEKCVKYMSR